jgi:hypothetical protein
MFRQSRLSRNNPLAKGDAQSQLMNPLVHACKLTVFTGVACLLNLCAQAVEKLAAAAYARQCARELGWKFELMRGDPSLLKDLLWGRWDDARFQIIEPGMQLAHATDESIFRPEPVS